MSELVSKGVLALRKSNNKAERVVVGGETFYFKKLTIDMEEELDQLVKDNQDPTIKPPEKPADDAGEDAWKLYDEQMADYTTRASKAFRKLTAEIMKYILLDETDKPFFAPEDDVYGMLNNVYAENFFKAYAKFRRGSEASPAQAEARFQK